MVASEPSDSGVCLQTPVQWSLASTMGGWGTQWGSTSNRGNRQEQSDGQQQGQNDGEHRREKSKREHDGEIGTAVDGGEQQGCTAEAQGWSVVVVVFITFTK